MGVTYKRKGPKYDASVQDRIRQKIADAKVATRLIAFYNGEVELTPTQASVGVALLKKLAPDLAATEVKQESVSYVARLPEPSKTAADWSNLYVPSQPYSGPQTGEDVEPVPDKAKH